MAEVLKGDLTASGGVGFVDRSDRTRIEVEGPDRVKFLHNLTTNGVKRLAVGRGHESFVTTPQGKTLGYVTVVACDDRLLIRSDPRGDEALTPHLTKYGVFDEVTVNNVAAQTFEYHLAGRHAESLLTLLGAEMPDAGDLSHRPTRLADRPVRLIRESPTGRPGITVIGGRDDAGAVSAALHEAAGSHGVVDIAPDAYEFSRIEAGTPVFGHDVTTDNLPQEVARDAAAINFVKGCYLGQETVARIDALGHVNRTLRGLRIEGASPPPNPGADLEADGKRVGAITSSTLAPEGSYSVALGYVRTSHAKAGTEVVVVLPEGSRRAVVCDLPMRAVEQA